MLSPPDPAAILPRRPEPLTPAEKRQAWLVTLGIFLVLLFALRRPLAARVRSLPDLPAGSLGRQIETRAPQARERAGEIAFSPDPPVRALIGLETRRPGETYALPALSLIGDVQATETFLATVHRVQRAEAAFLGLVHARDPRAPQAMLHVLETARASSWDGSWRGRMAMGALAEYREPSTLVPVLDFLTGMPEGIPLHGEAWAADLAAFGPEAAAPILARLDAAPTHIAPFWPRRWAGSGTGPRPRPSRPGWSGPGMKAASWTATGNATH